MEPTTYRFKRWKTRSARMAMMFASLALLQIVVLWTSLRATGADGMAAFEQALPFSLVCPILLLAMLLGLFATLRPGGLRREFLKLDDQGLTYGNIFRAHHWSWAELSSFSMGRRQNKEPIITFAVPGKPGLLLSHLDDKAMIEDVYDTPLEDIAARLNEYRKRAALS